jgi:protein TonB
MISISISRLGLCLFLLCIASMTLAVEQLNGLSSHTELKKENFIAALYVTTLTSDAQVALQKSAPMHMEIRVLAPKLSKRRFNRMWIEGMAINSSGSTLTKQADNMVKFTRFFKNHLIAGDIIELRNTSDEGTLVVLNNVELGNINNSDFFYLLLRTWIGKVPLSSNFRAEILAGGDIDSDLQARFVGISPSDERQQQISAWLTPKKRDAVAATTTAIVSTATISTTAPEPESMGTDPKIAAPEIAAPTLAFNSQPEVAKTGSTLTAGTDKSESEGDNVEVLTAESLLARQLYISTMLRHAYSYIKYPRKAVQSGWEGSVRLSVMVDREGKVKSILPIEETEYKSLNKAARKAIEKASPFPTMPVSIKGDDFEFSMPIVFRLK